MIPDQLSLDRLNLLHPAIRQVAILAYNEAVRITPKNVHPFITDTFRTFEQQQKLYNKGRTTAGPKVTNAKPGASYHNYGLSLDFCIKYNGKVTWEVDSNWMKVVKVFKDHGFTWGGDFRSFKDFPHLENTLGRHWKQLLALHNAGKVDKSGYVRL